MSSIVLFASTTGDDLPLPDKQGFVDWVASGKAFTLDGKFVKQLVKTATPFARDLALSADPEQRFLYVGNRSQAKVMVFNRKTLELVDSFGKAGSAPGEFGTPSVAAELPAATSRLSTWPW